MWIRAAYSAAVLLGFGATLALVGCVSRDAKKGSDASAKSSTSSNSSGGAEAAPVCPAGTRFNAFPRVCVTRGGFALGPFPLALQELCREKSPEDASTCVQKQDWPFELLMSLASTYKQGCPPGTSPGRSGVCIASDSIYGPFTLQQIMACRAAVPAVQQSQCDEIVWPPDFVKFANEASPADVKPERVSTELQKSSDTNPLGAQPKIRSVEKENPETAEPEESRQDNAKKSEVKKEQPQPSTSGTRVEQQSNSKAAAPVEDIPRAPTYCVYSWDERPGTADFTTIDRRLRSLQHPQSYPLDRPEDAALLGNKDFHALDVCGRARFLKGCFYQVVNDPHAPAAQTFRAWATGRLRPVEAYMAFAMSQTRLGLWHDDCWRGRCRGVGLARVTAAVTTTGRKIPMEDPAWRGITHNILTNLRYGLRLVAAKAAAGSTDLYQLAYAYNGIPGKRERFAQDVEKHYRQLLSCQLD